MRSHYSDFRWIINGNPNRDKLYLLATVDICKKEKIGDARFYDINRMVSGEAASMQKLTCAERSRMLEVVFIFS